MNIKRLFLSSALSCLCLIARADALNVEGLPIQVGYNVEEIQKALHTTAEPEEVATSLPGVAKKTQIRIKTSGIWVFFDPAGVSRTIRLDAPFSGNVGGIKIGSSRAYILKTLGKPAFELANVRTRDGLTPIQYAIDQNTLVRFDFDANDEVTTMFINKAAPKTTASLGAIAPSDQINLPTPVPNAPAAKTPVTLNGFMEMQNSAFWQTYLAVNQDLQPIFGQDADLKQTLPHLDHFQFSDETKRKLHDLTGNDNPLHLKSRKLRNGRTNLDINLDALDFKDSKTGASAHTSALSGKVSFNKSLNKLHATASWPVFHFETAKGMQLTAGDLSLVSDQTRGPFDIWTGTSEAKLAQLTVDDSDTKLHLMFDDMRAKTELKAHGKLIDMSYDGTIKSINWGSDELSQAHLAIRMVNLNAKDVANIDDAAQKLRKTKPASQDHAFYAQAIARDFNRALRHGGVIDIQDVSVVYHGKRGGLDGRVALDDLPKDAQQNTQQNAQDGDSDSPASMMKRLNVRINLHIPLGWVNDISRAVARNALQAQNKPGATAADIDAAADATAMSVVAKQMYEFERKKWIHVDHDTILSTIEFKTGKLFINGQPADLQVPAAAASAGQPSAQNRIVGTTDGPKAPTRVLTPGEHFTLAAGESVIFPAQTTLSMPNGTNVTINGNKNKIDALPGSKVAVAATASGPADNVAVAIGTEVIHADFGLFNLPGSGRAPFVPSKLVPYVPNQAFGWVIRLGTDKPNIKWREEFTVPAKPESWGAPEPLGTRKISEDGRVLTTERTVAPVQGQISNSWSIAPGDPKGHYVIRVTVEDLPPNVFEFDVQ